MSTQHPSSRPGAFHLAAAWLRGVRPWSCSRGAGYVQGVSRAISRSSIPGGFLLLLDLLLGQSGSAPKSTVNRPVA